MAKKGSIKDFEILNKLGQGSFGTVHKVRRKGNFYAADRNLFVIKMINISRMDKRGQQEAINEVKILGSLTNPYIVRYYDSFVENKTLHIVMEYCERGDLSKLIKNQMGRLLSEPRVWKFFIQMVLGLEYLHNKKILHRDIKSLNVFLAKEDSVRIGDLGVAKVLSHSAAFAHTMVGTPYYLSPELCEEKPYNVKSDVWALGCVLYEMCTLKHPFDAHNQGALVLKILRANYAPISSQFSGELKGLVEACLAKDYKKRPSIQSILKRPGVKEKAISMNVVIPEDSELYSTPFEIKRNPEASEESEKLQKAPKKQELSPPKPLVQKLEPPRLQREIPSTRQNMPESKPKPEPKPAPKGAPVPKRVRKGAPQGLGKQALRQKVVKPAPSGPHFKPPSRPVHPGRGDSKSKEEIEEIKEVENLPDFPSKKPEPKELLYRREVFPRGNYVANNLYQPKRAETPKERPKKVLKEEHKVDPKVELKQEPKWKPKQEPKQEPKPQPKKPQKFTRIEKTQFFELLEKPYEPPVYSSEPSTPESFTLKSTDWELSQTNFTPEQPTIAVSNPPEFPLYQVNYSVQNNSSPEESEDEAYNYSEESQDLVWIEEDEEEDLESTCDKVRLKLKDIERKEAEFGKLIGARKQNIIQQIGEELFYEFYELFKSKVTSEEELTEEDQNAIDEFVFSKLNNENTLLIYDMYKLLHLETEQVKCQESIAALRFELL